MSDTLCVSCVCVNEGVTDLMCVFLLFYIFAGPGRREKEIQRPEFCHVFNKKLHPHVL